MRNVVLVGHSGAGKTTLVECLLAATGTIPPGRIGRGRHHRQRLRRRRAPPAAQREPLASRRSSSTARSGRSRSTCSTPPATPTSSATSAPGSAPPTPRCSSISAVDGIDDATRMLWDECAAVDMPRAIVVTKLDSPARRLRHGARRLPGRVRRRRPAAVPAAPAGDRVRARAGLDRAARRARVRLRRRAADSARGDRGRGALLDDARGAPDRGDHRRERGRVPHGPLSRRRGTRPGHAHRRPRDGGRPRLLLPGARRLRARRARQRRDPRGPHQRLPLAAGTRPAAAHPAGRRAGARARRRGPGRPPAGRGRQDHDRPLRRAHVAGPRLLRDAASRRAGPRQRTRPRRARASGPRRRREDRRALGPAGQDLHAGRRVPGRRHLRGDQARARRDRRHPVGQGRPAAARSRGRCPTRCCPSPSGPRARPTRTSSPPG